MVCVLGSVLFLKAFLGSVCVWEVSLRHTAYVEGMLMMCGVSVEVCAVRLFFEG